MTTYRPGDKVRILALNPTGHIRTPWYARGKSGVVERILATYPNPEERAYGRSGLPGKLLYRVRFLQTDLWSDYTGAAGDTVDLEIYEHWLEPA